MHLSILCYFACPASCAHLQVLSLVWKYKGAVIGSCLWVNRAYSSVWFSTYKDAVVFLILIVVLIFQAARHFGEKIADKA